MVTDIHVSSAVAGMRDLGRVGVGVLAVGHGRLAAGLWSRHANSRAAAPLSGSDPAAFARAVDRLADAHGPLVVYPGCEASVQALLRAPGLGRNVTLPYPAPRYVEPLRDKRALPQLAAAVGLAAPATLAETSAGQLIGADLRLPYVVKPVDPTPSFGGALFIERHEDLLALVEEIAPGVPVLAQEHVPGPQASVAVVIDREGRVVERFQHRVIRTLPPQGGATTLAISVAPDEGLIARVARMLSGAGYWGLAQLDIVMGAAGPCVTDVNPRYYLSLPLASACGVNLSAAWHRVTTGAPRAAERGDYRLGVTYRWWAGDAHVTHGRLWPLRGRHVGALWDAGDPIASVLLSGQAVGRLLPGLARKIRRDALPNLPSGRGGDWAAG